MKCEAFQTENALDDRSVHAEIFAVFSSDADAREHWYAEAEKKVARALEIAPRHVVYWFNKACLASLRQDVKACVDALEQWRDCKPDASSAELDNDPDFDNVRDTPEFQEFRKKLADNK
ncbi:hypothetical protein [uncultured Desulfovibrio sp.]|uniref:TPR end-of-group domain-containing protein n=1 Tax=uncultured Desulfovibrio sp. TaxID=167968 RepID=UPI0026080747|nr:hypothetical protein [uncultured Desulfovibrio sp.]